MNERAGRKVARVIVQDGHFVVVPARDKLTLTRVEEVFEFLLKYSVQTISIARPNFEVQMVSVKVLEDVLTQLRKDAT